MSGFKAVCNKCRHYQFRKKSELFSTTDLQSPAVLKAKLERDQKEQERRLQEHQRFEAGMPFTYEPFNYPWCSALTPCDLSFLEKLAHLKDEMENALRLTDRRHLLKLIEKHQLAENRERLLALIEEGYALEEPEEAVAAVLIEAAAKNQEHLAKLIENAQKGEGYALEELEEAGVAVMNPVSGEINKIYALCDQINQMGNCPVFEPKA